MPDSARFWLKFLLLPVTAGVVLIMGFAFGVWIIVAIAFAAMVMIGVVGQWCAAYLQGVQLLARHMADELGWIWYILRNRDLDDSGKIKAIQSRFRRSKIEWQRRRRAESHED
jgi:hypothetical protein